MNGFIAFIKNFKYLGSYISYNLRDGFDMEYCIVSDTNAMRSFENVLVQFTY